MSCIKPTYSWSQSKTDFTLCINIGSRYVSSKKVLQHALTLCDLYLSINIKPYYIRLDLFDFIDIERVRVTIHPDHLSLILVKTLAADWPTLEIQAITDDQLSARRTESEKRAQITEANRIKNCIAIANTAKNNARDVCWKHEDQQRNRISQFKQKEKDEAHSEVLEWASQNTEAHLYHHHEEDDELIKYTLKENKNKKEADVDEKQKICRSLKQTERTLLLTTSKKKEEKPLSPEKKNMRKNCGTNIKLQEKYDAEDCKYDVNLTSSASLPKKIQSECSSLSSPGSNIVTTKIRSCGRVDTQFTRMDRRAGVVARDADVDDEHMNTCSVAQISGASEFSEQHSELLAEKSASFYARGDFASAISALSTALNLEPRNVKLLGNRAAAYLQLALNSNAISKKFERLRKSIADCNLALDVLPIYKSQSIRAKLLVRRGSISAMLGHARDALSDLEQASLLLSHEDTDVEEDIVALTNMYSQQRDGGKHKLYISNRATTALDTNNVTHEILEQIDAVLCIWPCDTNLLYIRARLLLSLNDEIACERCSSEALAILDDPVMSKSYNDIIYQFENMMSKLLHIRCLAFERMHRLRDAIMDCGAAIGYCAHNESLRNLMKRLQNAVKVNNLHTRSDDDDGRKTIRTSSDGEEKDSERNNEKNNDDVDDDDDDDDDDDVDTNSAIHTDTDKDETKSCDKSAVMCVEQSVSPHITPNNNDESDTRLSKETEDTAQDLRKLTSDANACFASSRYADALRLYDSALQMIEGNTQHNANLLESLSNDIRHELSGIYSNRSACHLLMSNYQQALRDTECSLVYANTIMCKQQQQGRRQTSGEDNNRRTASTLVRRSAALEGLGRLVDARHALEHAMNVVNDCGDNEWSGGSSDANNKEDVRTVSTRHIVVEQLTEDMNRIDKALHLECKNNEQHYNHE